tara:strand:- start:653 stop:1471 length:819 start_codon:yes stop_codon:yes gene_type:complete
MDWFRFQYKTNVEAIRKWGSLSIDRKLHGSRAFKRHNNKQKYNRGKYNSHAINFSKVALLLLLSPTSVLANAVSQSNTGSVTNQNYNVNNGNFHTNQYGGNIVCQGPMMNITPFSTFNTNFQKPFDHRYETPVYDPTDIVGDFDDSGNPIGDGTPDNPGNILYWQQNYSGTNKDSYSLGTGITLNFSIPLDRKLGKLCKEAASTQIGIQNQKLKNLELEWHVARVKHCGELMQKGINVRENSPFFNVCKDVFLTPKPNQIEKHYHSFSSEKK